MLVIARENGAIPWSWIVDETRNEEVVHQAGTGLKISAKRLCASTERTFGSIRFWIKVFSEKGTVGGIVRPVLNEFAVNFKILHGFGSATSLHSVAEESFVAIAISKFSTLAISTLQACTCRKWTCRSGSKIWRRGHHNPHRSDQGRLRRPAFVRRRDQEPRPSPRWFKRNYGARCWELDAMNPNDFRQRLRDEIPRGSMWTHGPLPRVEDAERESSMSTSRHGVAVSIFDPGQKCGPEGDAP